MVNMMIGIEQQLRILHWQTDSYAQHKALGSFYENLLDLTDDLAEMVQGAHGLITIPILTEKPSYKEALYCIADKLKYVEGNQIGRAHV